MTHGFATDKHGRNMNHSSWARFQTALQFLRRYFAPIRLPCASSLRRGTDTQVYLKLESELPTGSPDQTLQNLSNGLHGRFFRIPRPLFRGSPNLTKLQELKMQALLVVDVQNEFSAKGLRAVPNYQDALRRIAHNTVQSG